MAIHVRCERYSAAFHNLAQDSEVSERAFLVDEVSARKELAGRVIDRCHQAQVGASAFEPVVSAPVPEDHLTRLRTTIPAPPMLRGSTSSNRLNAILSEDASYRGSRNVDLLDLRKLLGEVLVVETSVSAFPELNDACANRLRRFVTRSSACIAVNYALVTLNANPLADSFHLTFRESEGSRTLCYRHLTTLDPLDDIEHSPLVDAHPHPSC